MGEDLDGNDVDVRQRKLGKNKNTNEDGSRAGESGHGSNKRKKRNRGGGGGDRHEIAKNVIPDSEMFFEAKPTKGKVIKKPESDSDGGDEGEELASIDSGFDEEEEASGSWLFKLIVIGIVFSLGFSLMWYNDGQSSTGLKGAESDSVEPLEGYVQSSGSEDSSIESKRESDDGYQTYQEGWSGSKEGELRSDQPEIISEVSETFGKSDGEMSEETAESSSIFETLSGGLEMVQAWIWSGEDLVDDPKSEVEVKDDQETQSIESESINMIEDNPIDEIVEQSWQNSYDQSSAEQQSYDQAYEQASYEPPPSQEPSYERPSYEVPQHEPPSYEVPQAAFERPSYEQPSYEAPPSYEPSYEQPAQHFEEQQSAEVYSPQEQHTAPQYEPYEQPVYNEPAFESGSNIDPSPVVNEPDQSSQSWDSYECPMGSYWDGMACVNPETLDELENRNSVTETQPDPTEPPRSVYPENY